MGNRVENPLFIISDPKLTTSVASSFRLLKFRDVEKQIAEWHFRRHVSIPLVTALTGLYIRPFWRDGKPTPSLPWSPPCYRSHHY